MNTCDLEDMMSRIIDEETLTKCGYPEKFHKILSARSSEFSGKPEICLYLVYLIIRLRRKLSPANDWKIFREILEVHYKDILPHMSSRWLISILDTYADFASQIERSNAILVSSFFNLIKLLETERLFYKDVNVNSKALTRLNTRYVPLWDGMTAFFPAKGDMLNNLLTRIHEILHFSPCIEYSFMTLLQRAVTHDTILRRMARINKTLASSLSLSLSLSLSTKLLEVDKKDKDYDYINFYTNIHSKNASYGSTSKKVIDTVLPFIADLKPKSICDYGCGKNMLLQNIKKHMTETSSDIEFISYDPAIPQFSTKPKKHCDLVFCVDVLEHIPEKILPGLLMHIQSITSHAYFYISCRRAGLVLPNGKNAHCTVYPPRWWEKLLKEYFPNTLEIPCDDVTACSFKTW